MNCVKTSASASIPQQLSFLISFQTLITKKRCVQASQVKKSRLLRQKGLKPFSYVSQLFNVVKNVDIRMRRIKSGHLTALLICCCIPAEAADIEADAVAGPEGPARSKGDFKSGRTVSLACPKFLKVAVR